MKTELRKIPGVGPQTEKDLLNLGYTTIESLKGEDPEEIYTRDCLLHGSPVDRCQLYVYRCAVYYASTENPDPEKLKWWNWKDSAERERVQIVPAVQHGQIESISALADEIWHEHYDGILSPEQIAYMVRNFQSYEAVREQMKSEGYQYFLLCLDGKEVGYAAVRLEEDRLFLSKLYILSGARRNGVAAAVLGYLEEMCRNNALRGIWLTVNKHNVHSIAAYEHLGFRKAYEQTADIGGGFVMDDFVMEKDVA